ncbi:MAG: TIGR03643 family protein [Cyclobacteriaceae bacterium]|nr:TIGR03643 family protein [Cyclobacteriaceae bacterium]
MLSAEEVNRIIEMAWEDRTPFEAIEYQFGLNEKDVIDLMRKNLKPTSWRLWRKRVQRRNTKHTAKRPSEVSRFKCTHQRAVSGNKISKR